MKFRRITFIIWVVVALIAIIIIGALLMAIIRDSGDGCLPFTNKELALLTDKAEMGHAEACWCLSFYYLKDEKLGIYWLRKSAEYGYPRAQSLLSSFLMKTEHDRSEAIEWLKKAADQNDIYACEELGDLYLEGEIIKKNLQQAEYWYRRSAYGEDQSAMFKLSKLLLTYHDSQSSIIEAYCWAMMDHSRRSPGSPYANLALEYQKQIIKRGVLLGMKEKKIIKEAEKRVKVMESKIVAKKLYDAYDDCLIIIGISKTDGS